MQWDFPVPSAGVYEVHLFFMNNYGGTKNPGQRIFDVEMEGTIVLNDYDIVADVGHKIGTMKGFQVQVTDGNLDLNFFHVKQDPLINGIEIVGPLIMGPQMSISQPTDGSVIPGQDLAVSWTYSNLEATDVFLVSVN